MSFWWHWGCRPSLLGKSMCWKISTRSWKHFKPKSLFHAQRGTGLISIVRQISQSLHPYLSQTYFFGLIGGQTKRRLSCSCAPTALVQMLPWTTSWCEPGPGLAHVANFGKSLLELFFPAAWRRNVKGASAKSTPKPKASSGKKPTRKDSKGKARGSSQNVS